MKRPTITLLAKAAILAATALLIFAACRQSPAPPTPAPTQESAAPTARPTAAAGTTILADGQLVATTPVLPLAFEASGRLLELAVSPGDHVAANERVALLDEAALQEAVANAALQVAQAELSLQQAQLTLDDLLAWEPDETAIALAEANLAAAEAALENAQTQDSAAGNSLTSARVNLDQARRGLADAETAHETAFDPARDWELNDPFRQRPLEAERDAAERNLAFAQENLQVAQAQYNLAWAGLNNDTAVSANASVLSASQALEQAQTGPSDSDIAAARLQVDQAALSLEQSQVALEQAQAALGKAELTAPWAGTVLSVEFAPGAMVSAGAPVITLLDAARLQFHTTNLSERDLAQIAPGQPVAITLKTYPGRPIGGTVAGIAPQATGTVGDAAVFTVHIDLDPTDLPLRPGMTGRAEITGDS
ncbi:MAG: efflux RND transporter periplasmic adaptor subunit [Anaerolineae bacterium]|nr:efflux RND transporter periplasmic adaptor subunit [Anaerolineae bacterium]